MEFMPDRKNPINVFCSYDPKDERLQKKLLKHLSMLGEDGIIAIQQDLKDETNIHTNVAHIILLLVSTDFLANSTEMRQALKRHEEGIARVIPIILRPVDWEASRLTHLKALPTNAKPIVRWGNRDEAFLDVAVGIRKAAIDIWLDYGNTCYKERNFRPALSAYRQVIGHSHFIDENSKITAYTNIGHIFYASHKHAQAMDAYEQAIKYGAQDASIYVNKGHIFYASHKHGQAMEVYEQAIEHGSRDASVYANQGHIFYASHKHGQAMEVYEQAAKYGSQDASIYANQGHIFYAANEHAQALDAYKQAIERGSRDASVYISKGRILSHLKQYKEALEDLKIAISIDARNASPYCIMGDIYFNLKQYKKSFGAYRKFTRVDYRGNGSLLNEFKFYKEILAAYWYIIQNDVSDNYIFYKNIYIIRKAFCNLMIWIKSLITWLGVILFSHNNAYYCNIRGRALLNLKHYKEALVAFELAIQADPENAIYHDNKGLAFQMLEDYQEALIAHIRAAQLLPEDAQAWHNKGDALVGLQRMEEAEQAYERAKQLEYNEYIDEINIGSEVI